MILKQHNIGVYDLLIAKYFTGCGLHGYNLVFHSFLTCQSNIAVYFQVKHCSCFKCSFFN